MVDQTWIKITNWLHLAKCIVLVGIIIFVIAQFAGTRDGQLAAYYWMAAGILATLFMVAIYVSKVSGKRGFFAILETGIPFFLPTLFTLAPLILLIVMFHSVGSHIGEDPNLPSAFEKFNYISFVSIILQTLLLNQFYIQAIREYGEEGKPDPNKWLYVVGFALSAAVTVASVAELYVIITHFLTDG